MDRIRTVAESATEITMQKIRAEWEAPLRAEIEQLRAERDELRDKLEQKIQEVLATETAANSELSEARAQLTAANITINELRLAVKSLS